MSIRHMDVHDSDHVHCVFETAIIIATITMTITLHNLSMLAGRDSARIPWDAIVLINNQGCIHRLTNWYIRLYKATIWHGCRYAETKYTLVYYESEPCHGIDLCTARCRCNTVHCRQNTCYYMTQLFFFQLQRNWSKVVLKTGIFTFTSFRISDACHCYHNDLINITDIYHPR